MCDDAKIPPTRTSDDFVRFRQQNFTKPKRNEGSNRFRTHTFLILAKKHDFGKKIFQCQKKMVPTLLWVTT